MKKRATRFPHFANTFIVFLSLSIVWGFAPDDLRDDDPVRKALYHTEPFRTHYSHVPNPPLDAKQKLLALLQSDPSNAAASKALAQINIELLDWTSAEMYMKQYVQNAQNKDAAYSDLETFYRKELKFDQEFAAILEHAKLLQPCSGDSTANRGPYFHFHRAIKLIDKYELAQNPETIYKLLIAAYPDDSLVSMELIRYYINEREKDSAAKSLEEFKNKFPTEKFLYLKTKADLLNQAEAFELLDKSYSPLWSMDLVRRLDSAVISAQKKGEYLESLKQKLQKNPLDLDAATRLFYAYHLAGNLQEAGNALNDYRLLKEKAVMEKKTSWTVEELYVMAKLQDLTMNINEAARYYYALYTSLRSGAKSNAGTQEKITADDALYGIFKILITADERPIQIGANNIDYYRDIASADQNPGVINGILSLILNGIDIPEEMSVQESRALGYFNRSQAHRLLKLVQKEYQQSQHLPAMYRDSLAIYQKYGMDQLIVDAGQKFFQSYRNTPEVLDVAIAVTDAYARMKQPENEWKTYDFILPIAAERESGTLLSSKEEEDASAYEEESEYDDEDSSYSERYEDDYDAAESTGAPAITYDFLLNRYINSLTLAKQYDAVLKLYRDQIAAHPDAEGLYVNFASYLLQNQLMDEEAELYKKAIQQFKSRSWYEKLARWYLRKERSNDFENISREIINLFSGTEVAAYLNEVASSSNPYRDLYIGLNTYAHDRFPHNLTFVRNLLRIHSQTTNPNWKEWEKLSIEYYFVDEQIRNDYLAGLAKNDQLPPSATGTNSVEKRFDADLKVWRSHFEEALPAYSELVKDFSSDTNLNIRTADLKRSLGTEYPEYYAESAALREHLAKINPADSAYWTTAGETLAEVEEYEKAKTLWENILNIDPQNPDRYLEVATIQWDYYLFDDALATISKIRKIKDSSTLFAYEAGAIYESKRDYSSAISEYSKGLLDDSYSAKNRLAELYGRPKLTPLVKSELQKHLNSNLNDADWWIGVIHFYIDQKTFDEAETLIAKAVSSMNKDTFSQSAIGLKSASTRLGKGELQEKIIQKQLDIADNDLNRIYLKLELARFYESAKRKSDADRTYEELYRNNSRSAGLIQEITSYYFRTEQYERAFAIYKEAIAASNAKFKKQYLREAAENYLEQKQYADALQSASTLLAEDPVDSHAFALVAKVHAEKQDYAALSAHYKQGLQNVKEAKLTQEQKDQQIAAMRRGIIQANLILKDYTAALDQYIEMINRDTESETLVRESSEFAAAHGLTGRLIDYYTKTAAASPRDHRWPALLGQIHVFSGNFEQAILNFQAAIKIRPENTSLRERLADTYQRSGKYQDAIAAYEQLYDLTYKDKRWLIPMAELHARIGKQERAIELYIQSLDQPDNIPGKFAVTQKAIEWGMPKTAIKYGNAGLKLYYSDLSQWLPTEGLAALAEAHIKNGQPSLAFQTVHQVAMRINAALEKASFESEELRSQDYAVKDVLKQKLPELVNQYLTGEQLAELDKTVTTAAANTDAAWKANNLIPFVQAAGLSYAYEQLLLQVADSYVNKPEFARYRNDLKQFYFSRHAFYKYAQWLETQWRKNPVVESRRDLLEIAAALRLANNKAEELRILREHYGWITSASLQANGVERYLELLFEGNHREELKKAAEQADFTAANYFVSKKDKELISIAIRSLAKNYPAVWQTTQIAMLGRELRDQDPIFDQSFRTSLDLRSIGEHLQSQSNEELALLGNDWFYYGTRYGEYLSYSGKADADYYLNSELEAAPGRDRPYYNLALFYKNELRNNEAALEHFALASILQPKNADYLDEKARSLYALGRKEEAVAEWKKLTEHRSAYSYTTLVQSASEFGFIDQVKGDVEKYLNGTIRISGPSGMTDLIPLYLQSCNPEMRARLLSQWVSSSPAPRYFGSTMLQSDLDRESQDVIYRAVQNYYKNSITNLAGQQARLSENEYIEWLRAYADQLLEWNEPERALNVIDEAIRVTADKEEAESAYEQSLLAIKTRALVRTKNNSEALSLMMKYSVGSLKISEGSSEHVNFDRYRSGYRILKEEGATTEALQLMQEAYEKLIAAGQTSVANYTGLAEIKLEQGDVEEAVRLLNRMIYSEPENLNRFAAAASVMEEHKNFEKAVEFRKEFHERKSWDMENRSLLAYDLLQVGNKKEALALASRVLRSGLTRIEDRVRAAEVYGLSASDLTGSVEMQQIQKLARSTSGANSSMAPYFVHARKFAIERSSSPSLNLLQAQIFVQPHDTELHRKLFAAYKAENMCLQALQTIDPHSESLARYATQPARGIRGRFTEDDQGYDPSDYYPIKEWKLSDSDTADLALQAADCAEKLRNFQSQMFFLTMASTVTTGEAQLKIKEQIATIESKMLAQEEADRSRWRIGETLGRES